MHEPIMDSAVPTLRKMKEKNHFGRRCGSVITKVVKRKKKNTDGPGCPVQGEGEEEMRKRRGKGRDSLLP